MIDIDIEAENKSHYEKNTKSFYALVIKPPYSRRQEANSQKRLRCC
jgi:hypothetical protein